MLLCLDVGNTHIYAGLFIGKDIKLKFRYPSVHPCTSDVLGLFLRNVLKENDCNPDDIDAISVCSVVPSLDYSVVAACMKYFSITPLELKPGVKTGLNLDIKNALELGADRIANAVGAINHFPNRNIIVVDFGTATTMCALSKNKEYLGGTILPGFKLSMEALAEHAAQLSVVDIIRADNALGKSTQTNIQAGLYYGQLGGAREIIAQLNKSAFSEEKAVIVGTGGYAYLFDNEELFTVNIPDLVLHGLRFIWDENKGAINKNGG